MEIMIAAVLLLGLMTWLSIDAKQRSQAANHQRLERKVDAIAAHLGLATAEVEGVEEIDALLREGKLIAAVARYRELTGADLLEAKQAVDRRAAELAAG